MDINDADIDIRLKHISMVLKLAKPGIEILNSLTPDKCHLWHMVTGLIGEVHELVDATSAENTVEELGDCEFYYTGIVDWLLSYSTPTIDNTKWYTADTAEISMIADGLTIEAALRTSVAELHDYCKKYIIYNKVDSDTLENIASSLYSVRLWLNTMRECSLGITTKEVLQDNIDKLAKRYEGHNYSDQAAHARADKVDAN